MMSSSLSRFTARPALACFVASMAGCPTPPPTEEPVPPIPARVLPAFIELPDACLDRIDGDGDGVFEEERRALLDDQQRVVRRTRRIEGVGLSDEVLLRLDVDGEVHDSEEHSTGADFVPQLYGNSHAFYEEGRLVRERFEGGDARFVILERVYAYDGDNLVVIDSESFNAAFESSIVEFDYDGDVLVERRTDDGKNGVDETVRFATETAADGSSTVTVTTEDVAGTHVSVQSFDPFGVLLLRDDDDDGDGVVDRRTRADVQGGALVGYDFDFDGVEGFEARQDYDVDADDFTLGIVTRVDGDVVSALEQSYGCFFAPVDRGGCEAPFFDSEAFGCARFRFGPAMDKARGGASIGVGESSFVAVGGFASFTLGPIYRVLDLVDVDGLDAVAVNHASEFGSFAGLENADGSVTTFGGLLDGVIRDRILTVALNGLVTDEGVLEVPRQGGQAARLADDSVVVAGGFTVGTRFIEQRLFGETTLIFAAIAPSRGTLTAIGDGAVYIGGDDGSAARVPSAEVVRLPVVQALSLPRPRTAHAAIAIDATRVLVLGGIDDVGVTDSVLVYDDDDRSFTAGASLPVRLSGLTAALLPDGRVFVAGGFVAADEPSALTFVLDGDRWLAGPSLNIPRGAARAVVLGDGRVAVLGGSLRTGSASSAVEILEVE